MPATDLSAAFIQDICERPHDDTPRLIYADWLEEQGGYIEQRRAEYIRVEVELAVLRAKRDAVPQSVWDKLERLRKEAESGWGWLTLSESYTPEDAAAADLNERYHALLSSDAAKFMGDRWYPPWAERDHDYYTVDWSRGFIFHINTTCADWLKYGREIVQVHPITSVALRDAHVVTAIPHKSDGPYICVMRGNNGHAGQFAYPWRDTVTVADPAKGAVAAYGREAIVWARRQAKLPPL